MNYRIIKYGLVIFLGSLIISCTKTNNLGKTVVAEVGEKKLYSEDIKEIIPLVTNIEDSTIFADDFINKWVKKELIIQKAEENLSWNQKDVTKELEEYRNSLIIYKYKNELIKQRMDTTVTDEQIREYYTNNTGNFNLNHNIVKAIFVKIPNEYSNSNQIKELCNNTSEEGLNELREYCFQYAKGFDIFIETWVDFDIVMKNIPLEIPEPELFLTRNNLIELNDSNYYYLVSIQDYKLKNEVTPIEYVTENIRNLILNRRKIEFLKQIENNVYTEGIRKNKFKIHNQKTNEVE